MTRTGSFVLAAMLVAAPAAMADGDPAGTSGGGSGAGPTDSGTSGGRDPGSGPLRLRGEAFVSADPSPVGLLTLEGEERGRDWLSVEALVWTGIDEIDDNGDGDALVALVRLRDPKGRGDARLGRFVVATGAIRPLHLDGVAAHGKTRSGTSLEVFGGVPVTQRHGAEAVGADRFDWLVGARIGQLLPHDIAVGASYYHQRDRGFLADEEVGVDGAAMLLPWLDVAGRAAYDTVNPGLADATMSAVARRGPWRFEVYGARRSPSRLLPATSLFAVLGDVPNDQLGAGARWRAAPRLDVWGSAAVMSLGSASNDMMGTEVPRDWGVDASLRAVLRLDERGDGALGCELRHRGINDTSSWTGVRGTARVPINHQLAASTEVELVIPDDSRGRGKVWPWGLVALAWRPSRLWTASAGVEGRASPESKSAVSGLVQLSRLWEGP